MYKWKNLADLDSQTFKCSFCDRQVTTRHGFFRKDSDWWVYICPNCARPTYFEGKEQICTPLQIHHERIVRECN